MLTKPWFSGHLSTKISELPGNVDKTSGFGALLLTKSASSGALSAKKEFLARFVNKMQSGRRSSGLRGGRGRRGSPARRVGRRNPCIKRGHLCDLFLTSTLEAAEKMLITLSAISGAICEICCELICDLRCDLFCGKPLPAPGWLLRLGWSTTDR